MCVRSWGPLVIVVLCTIQPVGCSAGGILHVFAPELDGQAYAVARPTVLRSRSLITVSESTTEWRMDQTFYNNNEFPLKGVYLLPLGKTQPTANPELAVDLITTPGELLSPEQFFPTLKELTRSMNDPSLLGLAGQHVLVVRSVSIAARQQKSFRVHFTSPSALEKDLLDINLSLDGERYAVGPVGELEVRVRLKLSRAIRTVFSPSHHISVVKEAPHRALVTAELQHKRVMKDFRLMAWLGGDDLDLRLLTHRSTGHKGTFLTFLFPPALPAKTREPDRDVVLLFDTSGSMGARYTDTAKRAVIGCLERLRPGDRFNVLTVGTWIRRMFERLVPANSENVAEAVGFVNSEATGGGTDLYNGLMMALDQFPSRRRPCMVILAGDGRGTVGITDPATIVEDVRRNNKTLARIFTLALGEHPDTVILDKLASATRGISVHVTENQDVETVMNRFLTGISPPTASELALSFESVLTEHVMPDPLPDMFGQETIMVSGSYSEKTAVSSKARLRARLRGGVRTITRPCTFPEVDTNHPYIPALWAMRRLALLLEREQLRGADQQTKTEIAQLTRDFGFRTAVSGLPDSPRMSTEGIRKDSGSFLWALKTSHVTADVESDQCRHINGKVFRREDSAWVDTLYRPFMQIVKIDCLGEEYFSVLQRDPELGPYLALGPRITLVRGKSALVVVPVSEDSIK